MNDKKRFEIFRQRAIKKEEQKLKSHPPNEVNVWSGFRVFGLVGWSVVIPTLIFLAIGRWLDHLRHDGHACTVSMLAAGVTFGFFLALVLIAKEIFQKK